MGYTFCTHWVQPVDVYPWGTLLYPSGTTCRCVPMGYTFVPLGYTWSMCTHGVHFCTHGVHLSSHQKIPLYYTYKIPLDVYPWGTLFVHIGYTTQLYQPIQGVEGVPIQSVLRVYRRTPFVHFSIASNKFTSFVPIGYTWSFCTHGVHFCTHWVHLVVLYPPGTLLYPSGTHLFFHIVPVKRQTCTRTRTVKLYVVVQYLYYT